MPSIMRAWPSSWMTFRISTNHAGLEICSICINFDVGMGEVLFELTFAPAEEGKIGLGLERSADISSFLLSLERGEISRGSRDFMS